MACRSDYMNDGGASIQSELDKVTRMLCDVCEHMEMSFSESVSDFLSESDWKIPELVDWWEEHKACDARRIKREREQHRKELARLQEEMKKLKTRYEARLKEYNGII